MEARWSIETSINFDWSRRRHIPAESTLHSLLGANLQSNKRKTVQGRCSKFRLPRVSTKCPWINICRRKWRLCTWSLDSIGTCMWYITLEPRQEAVGRNEGKTPCIFTLGTRRKWMGSFMPQPLYHRGNKPGNQWIGGWVGSRADLDSAEKNVLLWRKSNPDSSAVKLVKWVIYSKYLPHSPLKLTLKYPMTMMTPVVAFYTNVIPHISHAT
jgi:hypothetical protein